MKKAAAWSKTWVPVLCAVLSVALTAFNMLHTERVRREQERLSALLQPIVYTVGWEDSPRFRYSIVENGKCREFPAKVTRVDVTRGAIRSMTAVTFDGETAKVLGSFEVQAEKEQRDMAAVPTGVTVETEPQNVPLTEGALLYDYFFLWIEALDGERRLDMICHVIDLDSGAVSETLRWSRPELLRRSQSAPQNAREKMLADYWELAVRMEELPNC